MPRLLASVLATVALALLPGTVLGDSPERGRVFAVGDHVLAGETLTLLGEQLLAGDMLTIRLGTSAGTTDLGTAGVAADGTINFAVTVPAGTPNGYATITASDGVGTEWTTAVLVGERAEGPGVAYDSGGPFIDPAAIGLAMVIVGLIVVVVAGRRYFAGRPKGPVRPA